MTMESSMCEVSHTARSAKPAHRGLGPPSAEGVDGHGDRDQHSGLGEASVGPKVREQQGRPAFGRYAASGEQPRPAGLLAHSLVP